MGNPSPHRGCERFHTIFLPSFGFLSKEAQTAFLSSPEYYNALMVRNSPWTAEAPP